MGRAPCCDKNNVKKGPWSPEEDAKLKSFIEQNGTGGNWIALPQKIGLKRCGKSCRLRWLNYLRPNLKHGGFSEEEDNLICRLYISIGSRWSIIAGQLPGRTDNDIKNYWNTKLKKKFFGKQLKEHGHGAAGRPHCGLKQTKMFMSHNNMNIHQNPNSLELPAVMMHPVPFSGKEPLFEDNNGSIRKIMKLDQHHHQGVNGNMDYNIVYQMGNKSYESSLGLPNNGEYSMEDCLFLDQMGYNVNPQKLDGLEFLCDNIFNNWN